MFSPDSKFMQGIGRIADLLILNILFIITCLPVFTIGAATAAMYTLCFRMMREEENGIFLPYFRAFRDNFKQGTVIWLLLILVLLPALYYFDQLWQLTGVMRYASLFFVLVAFLGLMTGSYALPWISQFRNTTGQSLLNGLILGITHLPRTLAILVINLLPFFLLVFSTELFIQVSFLWVVLYFAAAAYMNCGILWHVFKPYRQQNTL